jgi:hypothetical protein
VLSVGVGDALWVGVGDALWVGVGDALWVGDAGADEDDDAADLLGDGERAAEADSVGSTVLGGDVVRNSDKEGVR